VNDVKIVWTNNAKTAAEDKELDDLVSALPELSVSHVRKATRDVILKEIERQVNNVNDHNVAASIATWLLNQDRYRCSSTAHNVPTTLQMPSGALSPVVLPACALDTPTCATSMTTGRMCSTLST